MNMLSAEDQMPISGTIIGVYDSYNDDLITQITTDMSGNGTALVDKGNYYLQVVSAADGYTLSDNNIDVAADWACTYDNSMTSSLTSISLSAVDSSTNAGLADAELTIYDSEGSIVNQDVTIANGDMTVEGINVGVYTIENTEAPIGYANTQDSFDLTIDAYGVQTGDTLVKYDPTSLIVKNTSSTTDEALAGTQYVITDTASDAAVDLIYVPDRSAYVPADSSFASTLSESDKEISTLQTGIDGTTQILYLPTGDYTVSELSAPDGYNPSKVVSQVAVTLQSAGILGAFLNIENAPIVLPAPDPTSSTPAPTAAPTTAPAAAPVVVKLAATSTPTAAPTAVPAVIAAAAVAKTGETGSILEGIGFGCLFALAAMSVLKVLSKRKDKIIAMIESNSCPKK